MKFVFRVDASTEIGTGHVMRCLTLANALREVGAVCRFVTRAHSGHIGARIAAEGFDVAILPAPEIPAPAGPPTHAHWAGVEWAQDASQTRALLEQDPPDWLVVDHYAFDIRWQKAVRPEGTKLMAIDDLADRPHDCDLLLDQNLGREAIDYDGLVPDHCRRLIGPQYSLLRPEFAQVRTESLARRARPGLRRIMVSMGGADAENVTGQVLDAMTKTDLPRSTAITIVLGSNAPFLPAVREQAAKMPFDTELRTDVSDMSRLMVAADLAIGGAGITSWERCCMGLPTLTLIQAENQRSGGYALAEAGVAVLLGEARDEKWSSRMAGFFRTGDVLSLLQDMSKRARAITDGLGCSRVVDAILGACPHEITSH